jgi:hypothetical protein
MSKAKKPTDKAIMDALAAKVNSITKGTAKPRKTASAPRGPERKAPETAMRKAAMIDVSLKQAIRRSGRTYYELGQAAGVSPSVILRFMSDDPQARGGDLRLSTAARIAAELGLALVSVQ